MDERNCREAQGLIARFHRLDRLQLQFESGVAHRHRLDVPFAQIMGLALTLQPAKFGVEPAQIIRFCSLVIECPQS